MRLFVQEFLVCCVGFCGTNYYTELFRTYSPKVFFQQFLLSFPMCFFGVFARLAGFLV
jgi:hypothetical protein